MKVIHRLTIDYGTPEPSPTPARSFRQRALAALAAALVLVVTAFAIWLPHLLAAADNHCTTETMHLAVDGDPDTHCSTRATTKNRPYPSTLASCRPHHRHRSPAS